MNSPAVKEPVLVTSAGTIVAQGIIKSLKLANSAASGPVRYRILAADMSPKAVGLYRSDIGIVVPSAGSPEYVGAIIELCKKHTIRAVFVGSEEELIPLSGESERIRRESGAVIVADRGSILMGRDKWKTFERLKKLGLPCAASALPENREEFLHEFGFPVIVKPREGHGSLQVHVASDAKGVEESIAEIERAGWKAMLQEFLAEEGEEFTSGVTVDTEGKTVMSSISMRRTLKDGQTYKAFIDDFPTVRKAAEETALKTGARGPFNVQARMSEGVPKAFEVNPRFSASCPIRAVAGVNEPDIVFRNWVLSEHVSVDSYRKLVCFRYLNEVYIPSSTYKEAETSGRTEGGEAFVPDYF